MLNSLSINSSSQDEMKSPNPDISPDETVDIVRQLEAQARQEFVRGYLSALLYAGLGDKTKAIDYLKREYLNDGNIHPTDIPVDAMLDGMEAIHGPRRSCRDRSNHNSIAIEVTTLAQTR